MDISFKLLKSHAQLFFDLLPLDWQSQIVPYWSQHEKSAKIYVLEEKGKIIGGGIVFDNCPPDILYFKDEAQHWFKRGYLYLGFIFITEDKRSNNIGSFWLDELKTKFPKQSYWLLIEDDQLNRFYLRNGFVLERSIMNNRITEWLYSYTTTTG